MSLLSENVATVVACQYLQAQSILTEELVATTIVSDTVTTNSVTLVDPADSTKFSTLEENGTTLDITATNVFIDGDLTVNNNLILTNPLYKSETININKVGGGTLQMIFTNGLLTSYTP
jgi:hypothetical protein